MRRFLPLFSALLCAAPCLEAQATDAQALVIITRSLSALGSKDFSNAILTGTIQIEEGSLKESGTLRFLQRGVEDNIQEVRTPSRSEKDVKRGIGADRIANGRSKQKTAQAAVSEETPLLPQALLRRAAFPLEWSLGYVGLENGSHHLIVRRLLGKLDLPEIEELSERHIWINSATGLPERVEWNYAEASGAVDRIAMAITYGDYREVNGAKIPFLIRKKVNGTDWGEIRIEAVQFDVPGVDAEFAMEVGQ